MLLAEDLGDDDFVTAFEHLGLDPKSFTHRNHLRLAWCLLRQQPLREAAHRCAEDIKRFATHHGSPQKFHLTLTLAFMHLVQERRLSGPAGENFEDFCKRNADLLSNAKGLISAHYSEAALADPASRLGFRLPDKEPLPLMPGAK